MSESSCSDDSIPNLSSYPPAFVALITAFIKRSEEAETQAHKALVILKAKDEQELQLQQRMEVLEKIACRLEEVMVPPLDLPKSPLVSEVNSSHPRDTNSKQSSHPPTKSLYERFPTLSHKKESSHVQDAHNCYEKCQYLIDGLERSNCQLREALAVESQQRMMDHEQHVATLAKVTQAVKELQKKHNGADKNDLNIQFNTVQSCIKKDFPMADEIRHSSKAAGDAEDINLRKDNVSINSNKMAVLDKEDFKKKVALAESIISILKCRLKPYKNTNCKSNKNVKVRRSKTSIYTILSKGSMSSNRTSKSSINLKLRRIHISSQCFLNALKKQNNNLKIKYQHLCEKFTESLTLCEKLQKELISLTNQQKIAVRKNLPQETRSSQTEEYFYVSLFSDGQEKLRCSKSTNLLHGRLEAAAKVMAKQCKQIQDLQKKLGENLYLVDSLKKRLSRVESAATGKDILNETTKKQLQETEKRNLALAQEIQQVKNSCCLLRQELALKSDECIKIKQEKDNCESSFEDMKKSLETKLLSLSLALQEKEELSDQSMTELQNKLSNLREQFIAQVKEASDRLVAADFKIQELYLGIETFLKLLFSLNSPELSPSSQAQAVQVASDILDLPLEEVQTILHCSRYDLKVSRWIRDCNHMVHEKVFAKNLGNLLIDAVLESRVA